MRPTIVLFTLIASLLSATVHGAEDAAALLELIQANDTSDVDRANAFEKIGDIADENALQPLAAFLNDEQWSHYARFAFQKMKGEQVTEVLIQSLNDLQGDLKVGAIVTIGCRRDPLAVEPLAGLLADADAKISTAAAVALGEIGTAEAAAALTTALNSESDPQRRESLASALLLAGQRLMNTGNTQQAISVLDGLRDAEVPKACRIGATQLAILSRGADGVDLMIEQLKSTDRDFLQAGLAVARQLPGERATQGIASVLEAESSPDRQVLLILALRDRGDKQGLAAILKKLKSESPAVQLAAIDAVGSLGDDATVPDLLSIANADNTDAILDSLIALPGSDVNAVLVKAAKRSDSSIIAVRALGRRRAPEAISLLFELSSDDSAAVRQEAIVALGRAVPQERFLDLLALWKSAKSDADKAAIQKAIHAAVSRATQPDACAEAIGAMIPASSGEDREFLFEQVRTAGGTSAVALMRDFATGSDESLQDAATETLGRWLSADSAPVLLQVAQSDGKFANRALGGYVRVFRQFELPEEERVAMASRALAVATRPTERNAAIEAMTRFPCVGTFELALSQLDAPGSETTAGQAVLTIARTVLDLDPATAKAGLKKLIDAGVNEDISESAKALLQ